MELYVQIQKEKKKKKKKKKKKIEHKEQKIKNKLLYNKIWLLRGMEILLGKIQLKNRYLSWIWMTKHRIDYTQTYLEITIF